VKYDRLWERLIEYIDEWASAREVPGGIEVTFEQSPGVPRTVEVVVTSADWDDYISTVYGTGDPCATTLKKKVVAMPDEASYLVYDTYDWEPSRTRELPEDDFNPGPGEWVVTDDDGTVIDRFADFDERE
jgi:hypothetical protein